VPLESGTVTRRLYGGAVARVERSESSESAPTIEVSTRTLAERFDGIAQRILVLPNELDRRVWRACHNEDSDLHCPVRLLCMGTSTHRGDFDKLIVPGFSQLKSEFGRKIELDVIGILDSAPSGGNWNVVHRPAGIGHSYPAFATWLQSLGGYDVGLAPLLDVVFNRCKSNVKWLEYSAMGLATIATDLPPYSESIEHEHSGLLVQPDANAFREAMHRLTVDCELRRSLKRNAERLTRKHLLAKSAEEPRLEPLLELARRPH
jgi:glycosyltransferase involved in cell wall biosynthesis